MVQKIQKMLGGRSANSLAQEIGMNQPTLSKWPRDAGRFFRSCETTTLPEFRSISNPKALSAAFSALTRKHYSENLDYSVLETLDHDDKSTICEWLVGRSLTGDSDAIWALGRLGTRAAIAGLQETLASKSHLTRIAAARALWHATQDADAVHVLVAAARWNPCVARRARLAALEALVDVDAQEAEVALARAAGSFFPAVRRKAEQAVSDRKLRLMRRHNGSAP